MPASVLCLLFSVFCLLLLFTACSDKNLAGSSSTETTNVITAIILDEDGKPEEGVKVSLHPQDYLAQEKLPKTAAGSDSLRLTTARGRTDSAGRFTFSFIKPGIYTIEALTEDSTLGAIMDNILVEKDKSTLLGARRIRPTGVFTGRVFSGSGSDDESITVQIYGLDRRRDVMPGQPYTFRGLAPHSYHVRISSSISSFVEKEPVIEIASGDTTTEIVAVIPKPFADWKHSSTVVADLKPNGMSLTEDLYNFPLLIRLNGSNFNFSQAKSDGSDLRITTSTGSTLPLEIERWDPTAGGTGAAEIWVGIDTIVAAADEHYLLMYWGNASAVSVSAPEAVFDTVHAFNGVWHLHNGPGAGAINAVKDATPNAYHGTSDNSMTETDLVDAVVGKGMNFDGVDDFIDFGTEPGAFEPITVQFWMKSEILEYHGVVDKIPPDQSGAGWTFKARPAGRDNNLEAAIQFRVGSERNNLDNRFVSDTLVQAWSHIAGTFKDDTSSIYINGVRRHVKINLSQTTAVDTVSLRLGAPVMTQTQEKFNGQLDEVRVSRTVRSEDWIRLGFENQKPGSRMVKIVH